MSKTVLIVEGGGAEGLYATGVIEYLVKAKGMTFDAMFGTSIGGAICLCLASNYTVLNGNNERNIWLQSIEKMAKDMAALSKWDLVRYPVLFGFLKGGYLRTNIKAVANRLFARDFTISDLRIYTEVFVTDVDAIEPVKSLRDGYRVDDACAMTTNIPGAFAAYIDPFDKHRIFDGGIACNSPVANAVKYVHYKRIQNPEWEDVNYVIIRMGAYKPMQKGGLLTATENLAHCFWIARYQCEQLSIKYGQQIVGDDKRFTTIEIPYSLGLLEFNPKHNAEHIKKGYDHARGYYANHANR